MTCGQPPAEAPRKPRVMLVGPWPPTRGGVTTFMLNVAGSQLAEQFEFLRFSTSRPVKHKLSRAYGYRAMFRAGLYGFCVSAITTVWHIVAFPFAVLGSKPDLVQVQASDFQAFWESTLYVGMCRGMRVPVLMRIGGSFDHFYNSSSRGARGLIRCVLSWPDRLIVQAECWAEFVRACGRKTGVVVVPNAVADAFTSIVPRGRRPEAVCLFIAGTEAVWKGADEVIAAIRILRAHGNSVGFRILAASDDLRRRIESEGLVDGVRLDGFVDRNGMIEAMRESDIFLLPSYGEGFPNSLLEAMAAGLAAIVTPVGAVPEIVDESCAVIVPVKDATALASAIENLAGDQARREQIASAGRASILSRFVQGAVFPVLSEAWQSLFELHSRRPAA
jgi:glycosyltransferase involved in cell wall biosynthesis